MFAEITGSPQQWNRFTIYFEGPSLTEQAATFTDNRLNVNFSHSQSGQTITVPGFLVADGDAADTGAATGSLPGERVDDLRVIRSPYRIRDIELLGRQRPYVGALRLHGNTDLLDRTGPNTDRGSRTRSARRKAHRND